MYKVYLLYITNYRVALSVSDRMNSVSVFESRHWLCSINRVLSGCNLECRKLGVKGPTHRP